MKGLLGLPPSADDPPPPLRSPQHWSSQLSGPCGAGNLRKKGGGAGEVLEESERDGSKGGSS